MTAESVKVGEGMASCHTILLQTNMTSRNKERAQAVPVTMESSVASPAWQLGRGDAGSGPSGESSECPVLPCQHTKSEHVREKLVKWWRQFRKEEWTVLSSGD